MSNIGSSALQTSKQDTQTHPAGIPPPTVKQSQFNRGTMNMLDQARAVVQNAVGQGQELSPLIYQMLGLQPEVEDHTAELSAAGEQLNAAQQQYNEARETMSTIRGIPPRKRSREQRKQLRQLTKQAPAMEKSLGDAKTAYGQLETMPKRITGLTPMDPNAIPAESPFSAQNPLNQAQATQAKRLNEYMAGGEVDPTLKHQYDSAEQALRAKLSQRFGPDYEASTVGQMALSNFSRQKNEAFATWNQQQVEKYNSLAFTGAANLQNLLAGRIGLLEHPEQAATGRGNALANAAQLRLQQQQIDNQYRLGLGGVATSTAGFAPLGTAAGGLGTLLTTPYNKQGDTLSGAVGSGVQQGWQGLKGGASDLYNWATGAGAAGASAGGAAAADAAAGAAAAGATSEVGASMLV
jgi:hypothetical protein